MEIAMTRGGAWLFEDATDADVFTPERLSDEHRLMALRAEDVDFVGAIDLDRTEQRG